MLVGGGARGAASHHTGQQNRRALEVLVSVGRFQVDACPMYRVTLYPTTDTQYLAAVNHGGLCCPEQLDMPINYAEPATEISDGHWTANTMRESDTAIGGNETYAGFKTLTHTIYKNTNSPGKLHPLNGFQAGELVVIAPITTRGPRSSARSSKIWATMQVTGTVARGRSRHTVASSRRVAPLVVPLVGHGLGQSRRTRCPGSSCRLPSATAPGTSPSPPCRLRRPARPRRPALSPSQEARLPRTPVLGTVYYLGSALEVDRGPVATAGC